jgi:hypothetical protein
MVEATTDTRITAAHQAGVVSIKLIQHRNAPVVQGARTARSAARERHEDARLEGLPPHQPTPAECYGCVDWFQF